MYENGVNYSALATARSAVSSLVNDSVELGKHTLVRRFMKGAFNSRPSLTKRVDIWDPAIVLTSLKGYKQASLLTLRELTLKTTMLLALLSAQRVQTLVSLDIHHMTMGHNTITFHISQLMKQSRPKFHLKDIVFTEYPSCRNLCIVTLLNEYLERTRALCEGSRLLISFAKPHKAVTTSTVSRWLKLVLAQAGIHDWTAHSTRSASTSAAHRQNVPIDSILAAAGWSSESTFARFYNKHVRQENFGDALLASI